MYYDSRRTQQSAGRSFGTVHATDLRGNGTLYVTDHSYTASGYDYDLDEYIVDYDPIRGGRFTSQSGYFTERFAQSFKPVKHQKKVSEFFNARPVKLTKYYPEFNIFETWAHSGDLSRDFNFFGNPEKGLNSNDLLKYIPFANNYYPSVDWGPVQALALSNPGKALNDNTLLSVEQVDVATFLAEARDIRRLADLVKFQRNLGDVSDKFLGINFGVLPVVSDIKKMYENVQKIKPALKAWNDMVDSQQTRSYHQTLFSDKTEEQTRTFDGDMEGGIVNYYYSYEQTWSQEFTRKSHVYVKPSEKILPTDVTLQASLWGLDKPLRTVWNVIPMSFAVDWVVNVGDIIDDFEYRQPDLKTEIVGAGVSEKLETFITTKVFAHVFGRKVFVGHSEVKITDYVRCPTPLDVVKQGLDERPIGPLEWSSELSGMQLSLSAALVHQRMFKF